MKKISIILSVILICIINIKAFAIDYSKTENWVINSSKQENVDYGIFYIYPTLVKTNKEELFDWSNPEYNKKAKNFSNAQMSVFNSKRVRVFAPFVRQLDFLSILKYIKITRDPSFNYKKTAAYIAVEDTKDALNYYLEHYNNGRPFILIGHSQGAADILYAIKEMDLGNNFLAAYLLGFPNATKDVFCTKDAKPATGKSDLGVLITWNSQKEGSPNPLFSTKNGYVINPLNWKTTEEPASRFSNITSKFYNAKKNSLITKHFLTGAKIDKANGVLLLNLPTKGIYDANAIMGEGIFHTSDFWTFSNAIVKNANHRYNIYKKQSKANKKYTMCELGDLVGNDVKRLYISGYYIDYHSEDFKPEQVKTFAKECFKEGITTQYQMDCCTTTKMYGN